MFSKLIKILFFSLLLCSSVFADQFQILDLKTANEAVKRIPENSILISYCSECNNQTIEIWRVKKALVANFGKNNDLGVTIVGKRLYESKKTFNSGEYREPIEYNLVTAINPDDLWFVEEGIDLAYVYVPVDGRVFDNLADRMKLSPEIKVHQMRLPMSVR